MTASQFALRVERLLDHPREAVFRAWTEKAQLEKWFHFSDEWAISVVDIDLRVGGSYRIGWKAPDGRMWYELGEYREILPPERLVQTCRFDFPGVAPEETLLTIEFHERGRQTLVVVKQEGYRNAATRDNHQQGWPGFLDQLAKRLGSAA